MGTPTRWACILQAKKKIDIGFKTAVHRLEPNSLQHLRTSNDHHHFYLLGKISMIRTITTLSLLGLSPALAEQIVLDSKTPHKQSSTRPVTPPQRHC